MHSAKFENEGRTESIRKVVQRYELEHPVVNDHDFQIWRSYGANAWPTFALIDPEGKLIGTLAGEGHYALLDKVIGKVVAQFDAAGKMDRTPLGFEPDTVPDTALRFRARYLPTRPADASSSPIPTTTASSLPRSTAQCRRSSAVARNACATAAMRKPLSSGPRA